MSKKVKKKNLIELLRYLLDDFDECHYDHHGGCQEHGYVELKPGEMCPVEEARQIVGWDV